MVEQPAVFAYAPMPATRTQVAARQAPQRARVPVLAVHWAAQAGPAVAISPIACRLAAAAVEELRFCGTSSGPQLLRLMRLSSGLLQQRRLQVICMPPAVEAAGAGIQRGSRRDEIPLLRQDRDAGGKAGDRQQGGSR